MKSNGTAAMASRCRWLKNRSCTIELFRRSPSAPQARCRSSFHDCPCHRYRELRSHGPDRRRCGDRRPPPAGRWGRRRNRRGSCRPGPARPNPLQLLRRELGRRRWPASHRPVPRQVRGSSTHRRIDRCSLIGAMVSLSGLPAPAGVRLVVLALKGHRRPRKRLRTTSMYSRVRARACRTARHASPPIPAVRDTRPRRKRPPVNTSRLAAVIAVAAGVRAGICITAEPTSIFEVWAAIQARTVGLSEPYASDAQTTAKPRASAC